MSIENEEQVSLFRRFEEWSLYHDLHIWYGFISILALCTLLFIVDKEMTKTDRLAQQLLSTQKDLSASQLLVIDLRAENEKQRQLYLMPKAETESLDKAASKVTDKLNKVQDVLIDKVVAQPKPKTQIITSTIEVKTVVNKELKTMMKDSYCATVPNATECKR